MHTIQDQLAALATEIETTNVCPDLKAQATQLVFGFGNPNAEVVFIGEAPGKKEDEQGRPFIGASGKLLDALLAQANMKRDDVYITNIVKYRPPSNRDPSVAEKAAFSPYLTREIELVSPKVIITLGRHSTNFFLPDAIIGDVHGQPQTIQLENKSYTLLPLYHPAAALFNGGLRKTLFEDFEEVPKLLTRQ